MPHSHDRENAFESIRTMMRDAIQAECRRNSWLGSLGADLWARDGDAARQTRARSS